MALLNLVPCPLAFLWVSYYIEQKPNKGAKGHSHR